MKKKKFVVCIVAAFLAGSAVTGGACAAIFNGALGYVKVSKNDYREMNRVYERYSKLETLYEAINENFYSDADDNALVEAACKGLVSGLDDPYSAYMTADEYKSWKASATGEYSGVGITFGADDDGNFTVISVEKDSPAQKAGIKAGDILLKADGKEYDDLELLANAIRGTAGSRVKLTYSRDGRENEVTMTRQTITQHSVESKMINGATGYISISSFIDSTGDDFEKALSMIEGKGAENLVLDLRDNGGGLVDEAVDVADQFLDEGVVVYVEDKQKNRSDYDAEDGRTNLNTVVLINENSASASEILAAALKDNGFKLVGETSYGKGVIQSTSELSDGSALKLTIMQYFSPKGNKIHKKGVKPDYEVKNDENSETDAQLEKALNLF